MPRRPSIRRSSSLDVHLDEAIRTRLDIELWSSAENCVPKGAYKRFFDALLSRVFAEVTLDLSPYLGSEPGALTVRGNTETLNALKEHLQNAGK